MSSSDYDKYNVWGIGSLLTNWLVSVGAVVVILFSAQFIPKVFFPIVVLACQFVLMRRANSGRENKHNYCYLLPYLMARVLFISAIIMVAINIYYIWFIPQQMFDDGTVNRKIPYITILIVAPVSSVILLWALIRGLKISYCRRCQHDHGVPAERGFFARIAANENRYQLRMLALVSVIATIYSWTYYFVRYSNASMNSADRFYYNYIPLMFYLFSVVYMSIHYWSLFAFYQKNIAEESANRAPASYIRFILVCGDSVFLGEKKIPATDNTPENTVLDTPFRRTLPLRERLSTDEAESIFSEIMGRNTPFDIRFLYKTHSPGERCNFFHFLCGIQNHSFVNNSDISGSWFTQSQLGRLFTDRKVDLLLAGEMQRVYTMAKAFKAYDREGHRLHSIRHYSPAFHLSDLMQMKLDFNDPTWLFVADDNEDKPLYRLRRIFRRSDG